MDADAPLDGTRTTAPRRGGGPRSKHWCFTWNNYNEDTVQFLQGLGAPVVYLVAGREVGSENGTPHLQGFVKFSERKRYRQVQQILGNPTLHVEAAREIIPAIRYCKKEGDFFEVNAESEPVSTGSGDRTDLEAFKEDVKQGNVDHKSLRELHSEIYAKYPRFVHLYVQDNTPKKVLPDHDMRDWQRELKERLDEEPDDRTIEFIVDYEGNSGKSWFAHKLAQVDDRVQVLPPGKLADMAYALDPTTRCLIIDAPRSKQGEYIQYEFLESVKNGYVFSTKYESYCKQLEKCHVVVMMNEMPDMTKLSMDRYKITELGNRPVVNLGDGDFLQT